MIIGKECPNLRNLQTGIIKKGRRKVICGININSEPGLTIYIPVHGYLGFGYFHPNGDIFAIYRYTHPCYDHCDMNHLPKLLSMHLALKQVDFLIFQVV
jgi:hypothetical protein